MGVSTDAIIIYGTPIGNLDELERSMTEEEWDNLIETFYISEDRFGLIMHCSIDYPEYFIGYEVARAYRGYPMKIEDARYTIINDNKIKEFCDSYELPYSQPTYYLASYWG